MEATVAEISHCLATSLGQSTKHLDPSFPIKQPPWVFIVDRPCLVNTHMSVTQALCCSL